MDRESISDLIFDEHLAHRQLNEGTKAVMAVKRLEYCKREAKEAKIEAGKLGGKIGGRGREKIGLDTTESNPISRKASARAAAKVGLSYASVERAAKAISNSPLVEKPLEQGKLKIREALLISELPTEKQQEIIALPKEEIPIFLAATRAIIATNCNHVFPESLYTRIFLGNFMDFAGCNLVAVRSWLQKSSTWQAIPHSYAHIPHLESILYQVVPLGITLPFCELVEPKLLSRTMYSCKALPQSPGPALALNPGPALVAALGFYRASLL